MPMKYCWSWSWFQVGTNHTTYAIPFKADQSNEINLFLRFMVLTVLFRAIFAGHTSRWIFCKLVFTCFVLRVSWCVHVTEFHAPLFFFKFKHNCKSMILTFLRQGLASSLFRWSGLISMLPECFHVLLWPFTVFSWNSSSRTVSFTSQQVNVWVHQLQ